VFHFHAAGLPEIYPLLPWWLRPLFNLAYRNADLAIFTTEATASQGAALGAKAVTVIPNGIPDNAQGTREDIGDASDYIPQILFMGTLCEGKGLLVLIEACALVQKAGLQFRLTCAGAFRPESFKKEVGELIGIRGLTEVISFPGMLIGDQKVKRFREADVFCYPSHYDCSPIVLIEAMSFGLPIIATRWRGIPDVVGRSGGAFIVEPKRPDLVAERLKVLLRDSELRVAMGRKNRAWFYGHYTLEMFRGRMEKALLDVGCVHNGSG